MTLLFQKHKNQLAQPLKERVKTSKVWNHLKKKSLMAEERQNVCTVINFLIIKKDMVHVFFLNTMIRSMLKITVYHHNKYKY